MPDQEMNFEDLPPDEDIMANEDEWLNERYPVVSGDFVEQTLAKVVADREEIQSEAAKVEEIQFEPGFLEKLDVPAVSSNFVEETLAKVVAQRDRREDRDQALHELIQHYRVPQTSPHFVPRTLAALGLKRGKPAASIYRRAMAWSAAAALLVAIPLVALNWSSPSPVVPYPTAESFSTGRWGSAMAEPFDRREGEMPRIRVRDAEITLAHLATRKSSTGE